MTCRASSRRARGEDGGTRPERDPDLIRPYLEDAAHYSGGHAEAVAFPRTEAEVSRLIRTCRRVLPIGAQSSLTGGATPMGEVVVSSARLDRIVAIGRDRVRVQPGVPLATLQDALTRQSLYYPPAPTYDGAFVGGTIATNAAGAATFKYGATRKWVRAITVVLASGEVLDLERGEVTAADDGTFSILDGERTCRVPVPGYRMPDVPKRSAGYFAEPGMDLIDLFIGSEGTLGFIVEATLDVVSPAPTRCQVLVPFLTEPAALDFVATIRGISIETRRTHDPRGMDVSAIEQMDRRCLELLREDGADRKYHVGWPDGTAALLLVQIELPAGTADADAFDQVASIRDAAAPDTPLVRFCRLLDGAGVLDHTEMAMPGDRRRAGQFFDLREAVPSAVKQRVGIAKERVHPAIEKTAADMIVPFDRFAGMLAEYRRGYERRNLDYAIWGHISDGNVHPNVIPRTLDEMNAGREAILEFGRSVIALGGCPLAEHGVGRSPLKQALLRMLYGEAGVAEMQSVKRALDPEWKLSPGVLFPKAR
jgi:D-lactate dehydrogenase (cytochrome)